MKHVRTIVSEVEIAIPPLLPTMLMFYVLGDSKHHNEYLILKRLFRDTK